jgi:hypothetical protein
MSRAYTLSGSRNFQITATSSAVISLIIYGLLLLLAGIYWLRLPVPAALLGSLLSISLHWFSVAFHNFGHFLAAKGTGYPMIGLRFWFLLGTCIYPPDEPALPKAIHVRRALGGPLASAGLAILLGVLSYATSMQGGVLWYVFTLMLLENIMIFSLGAFLPLGFTDGSTLLSLRGKPDPVRL